MASSLVSILEPWRLPVRVMCSGHAEWSDWDSPLFAPAPAYIETGRMGPVPIREVVGIEINPVEKQRVGRLLTDRQIDRTEDLTRALKDACFEYGISDGIVIITFERANQRLQLTGDGRNGK